MSREVWHGCYECGAPFRAPDLGPYTSRQLCEQCKAERAARWERAQAAREQHVHEWAARGSNRACACGATLLGSEGGE